MMEGILSTIIVLMLTLSAEGRRTAPCDAASIDTARDSYRDRYQRQPNIVYIMADDLGESCYIFPLLFIIKILAENAFYYLIHFSFFSRQVLVSD